MSGPGVLPASSASLDLTHVRYDADSKLSLLLALVTLSPILLMASYAALAVQTRELAILLMWAGQFGGEALNYVLKHAIRQDRPHHDLGEGYGFPSSHSQYMAYFAAFLICHLRFRHRLAPTGIALLDGAFTLIVHTALVAWAGAVGYSSFVRMVRLSSDPDARYHLLYHTPLQVFWGLAIGAIYGTVFYALTEYVPASYPRSLPGRMRTALLAHPVVSWLRIRDGWAVWGDAGQEAEWVAWRKEWDRRRARVEDVKRN